MDYVKHLQINTSIYSVSGWNQWFFCHIETQYDLPVIQTWTHNVMQTTRMGIRRSVKSPIVDMKENVKKEHHKCISILCKTQIFVE